MTLFTNQSGILKEVNEKSIKLERDIQKLSEENMQAIFRLKFIETEFEHNGLRLDSVAYDEVNNAFVIIEYKRDRSFSVVDQGYAYLALLLNNKAEFILLYNEKTGKQLSKNAVDWSQSRVIFVAQSFTIHQQQAINFKDMPIELWQVRMYENGMVTYNQLKAKDTSESIKTVSKDSTVQSVASEVKVYSVSDHFSGSKQGVLSLYESLRDRLTTLAPEVYENPRRNYIGFALKDNGYSTFVYIEVRANALHLVIPRIRPEDVIDPLKALVYKKGSVENKNTPESILLVKDDEDVEYAIGILRQVLRDKFIS